MANDNDFDEWLDDVETDDDGELDQLNIDALLSAVDDEATPTDPEASASSELDQTNIDALLGISNTDTPDVSDDLEELDQDNIDALLNGGDDTPAPVEEPPNDDIDELDQNNIDALLSGEDNADIDELDQDNIDALLGSSDDAELDQNNIDDLLSGDDDADIEELDQDNIDALLGSSDDSTDLDELDQDNIDSLLGGDDQGDDLDELDQDNIDALLSGTEDTPPETVESDDVDQSDIDELLGSESDEIAKDLEGDLDQDDLDDLFAESSTPATPEPETPESGDEVEQDDIDALFNDIDAATSDDSGSTDTSNDQSLDELFAEGDSGDETTLSAEASEETAFDSEFDEMDQLFSELEDDSAEEDDPFQAEEIDFAEMLDSSSNDSGEDEFLTLGDEEEEEDEFAMAEDTESAGNETNIDALLSADDEQQEDEDETAKGFAIPAFITSMNKATMSTIGGGLALLLILGIYFMFSGGDGEDTTLATNSTTTETNTTPTTTQQDNFIPVVADTTLAMSDDGGELSVELQATDEDDQPLIYEITSKPNHGRLSGTAPNFTYLANSNFPGEDSFEYTVHDGVDTSATALVTITGPDLKGQALARQLAEENIKQQTVIIAKEIKPKKPAVLAKNVHFYTDSTAPITINWRRIWKEANKSDYDPKTHVEIIKTETVGQLAKVTGSKTTFTPDPYSEGTDLIFYRFKKNGFRSATKTISIDISLGNPAPEINLAKLQKGYPVGQNVFLDTAPSRDDTPDSLQFTWEQISGSPVSLQILEDNGSRVVFVMPSSFYNKENSGPTFMITATDQTGKTTTREITTNSISRRQAALWRGINGGVAEDPALKGQYFPWPYDD